MRGSRLLRRHARGRGRSGGGGAGGERCSRPNYTPRRVRGGSHYRAGYHEWRARDGLEGGQAGGRRGGRKADGAARISLALLRGALSALLL